MFRNVVALFVIVQVLATQQVMSEPEKQVYFGDTHLHSSNSFDAYLMFNRDAGPDVAYRWAKGIPVIHPFTRTRVQIDTPLDFLVLSDHAEYLGIMPGIDKGTVEFDELGLWDSVKRWVATFWLTRVLNEEVFDYENFVAMVPPVASGSNPDPVLEQSNKDYLAKAKLTSATATNRKTWHEIIDAADQHNDPGNFTALIGWEWSSLPGGSNLHRVIFTPDDGSIARQYKPFSFLDSQYPEDLWHWLEDKNASLGARFIAIPHNSNGSKGHMFNVTSLRGEPIGKEYASLRSRWEPVVEITQIKGDSETHSSLSPDDEFADFENFSIPIMNESESYKPKAGDFVRSALKRGLSIEQDIGINPYQLGVIGSTDSHTGLSSAEENNFWGKMAVDSLPELKSNNLVGNGVNGWSMSASGLAAVWAEENTREAIFSAFQRREVYATTGSRIRVKVLATWDDRETGIVEHVHNVPMGSQLKLLRGSDGHNTVPSFYIQASRDPKSAGLDRIQMVKGWIDSRGTTHEKVYNLAWSGDRKVDLQGKLTTADNSVNIKTGKYDTGAGSDSLTVQWSDPDFTSTHAAFYYVRVLEMPTPRHSLLDAIALNQELDENDGPATIQERAYTSSIWYNPKGNL